VFEQPPKTPYQGVVSRDDIRALYETHRANAIRYAHFLGANGDSEDLVHDVVLWLIERQDFLKAPRTKAYLFVAVKREVQQRGRGSYVQRTILCTDAQLVDIEAMEYAHEHGRPRTPEVTLA
jgi:DNA-directed RNA polymerase specialized sigma24 family protein